MVALLICTLLLWPIYTVVASSSTASVDQAAAVGRVTLKVSGGSLSSITAETPGGQQHTFHMLPGSGTTLEGCVAQAVRTLGSETAGAVSLERTWLCGRSTYHNLSRAVATTLDTFVWAGSGAVHWRSVTTSDSPVPWSTPIVASLGFADWTDKSTVWLGGPRSGAAPGLEYDPFAPFPISDALERAVDSRVGTGREASNSGNSTGWFVANGYDATYNCLTGPCVKSDPPTTKTAPECQALCEKFKGCLVYAWSDMSHHCWFRTDGVWGAPGTDHRYKAVSGCKAGSDPVTGNPYVKGCGSIPPLGPGTRPAKFYYGSADNNIAGPRMSEDTASVLPMLNRIEPDLGFGLSLVQSPEDTPIVAWATAALADATPATGCWLNWTRAYHRLGGNALPSNFSADFIAHGPDWRPAAAWMHQQYPRFFQPDPSTHETLQRIAGTGSYADMRGIEDLDEEAARHYKQLGWGLNWDSTARFPWHGEWIPTAEDGFGEQWLSCFAHGILLVLWSLYFPTKQVSFLRTLCCTCSHTVVDVGSAPPDGHANEPCMNVSYSEINSWYRHINAMGKRVGTNFSSCQCNSSSFLYNTHCFDEIGCMCCGDRAFFVCAYVGFCRWQSVRIWLECEASLAEQTHRLFGGRPCSLECHPIALPHAALAKGTLRHRLAVQPRKLRSKLW